MKPGALLVGLLAAILALLVAHGRDSMYNNYVLLADAFVHGRIFIDSAWPGPRIDAVLFDGHRYVVNDPVPALLLIPLVALVHERANETVLACLLFGVAAGAAWALLERLGVRTRDALWLLAFLVAGTDLLWCSMLGDVWFCAQTSAVAFLLLAMCELAGKGRGWLVALWIALALGSRFTVVMALPVVAWWVWRGFLDQREDDSAPSPPRVRSLAAFVAALVPFFVLWIAYNEARWHVPWDAGHSIFYRQDPFLGGPTGGPFSLDNLGGEPYSFFVLPPEWNAKAHALVPPTEGTALWFTSPALLLALLARSPRRLVLTLWIATMLVAGPSLLYYANGGAQFGMRHALDFEPFLFVLMALAARGGLALVWQALIGWSVAAGSWGIWYWNTVVRTGNL